MCSILKIIFRIKHPNSYVLHYSQLFYLSLLLILIKIIGHQMNLKPPQLSVLFIVIESSLMFFLFFKN